eukprot:gnl/TRDRNA2_/TRDRNA2_121009_c1_seq1.p1 gnl/TRDRNA2_/TRDRNA2_121009_c1~~gnl/TRDRNA2_/TRDRNA2_121009_c1_seq1.p1  ORF type:complete len:471 (-),score=90.12 gnl/TRDRNA2_/TRDRNA2_121009_c1_seq1:127-1506(-)
MSTTASDLVGHVKKMRLAECEPRVLRGFVEELLLRYSAHAQGARTDNSKAVDKMAATIGIWVHVLHKDLRAEGWHRILQEMGREVAGRGGVKEFGVLAQAVAQHFVSQGLDGVENESLLAAVRELLEWLLDRLPAEPSQEVTPELCQGNKANSKRETAEHLIRVDIVVSHWSEVASTGCSPDESGRLFVRCPAGQQHKLAACVVRGAVRHHTDRVAAMRSPGGALETARRTLHWLAAEGDEASASLSTLAELWPRVLGCDQAMPAEQCVQGAGRMATIAGGDLDAVLDFFGRRPNEQCVKLVDGLIRSAAPPVVRSALRWLGGLLPRDAAQLWPVFLQREAAASKAPTGAEMAEDVSQLLRLCEDRGIEPPELPAAICGSSEVLAMLVASPLPHARLTAVRTLGSRDLRPGKGRDAAQRPHLAALRDDVCAVVAAAARLAWAEAGGGDQEVARKEEGGS